MKKFFSVMMLAAIIFFCQNNFASAQDVYVGTSNATGWDCYIMTETIKIYDGGTKQATLKMITNSGNARYLDYSFNWDEPSGRYFFKNMDGFRGIVDRYETPIEYNMLQVILRNR